MRRDETTVRKRWGPISCRFSGGGERECGMGNAFLGRRNDRGRGKRLWSRGFPSKKSAGPGERRRGRGTSPPLPEGSPLSPLRIRIEFKNAEEERGDRIGRETVPGIRSHCWEKNAVGKKRRRAFDRLVGLRKGLGCGFFLWRGGVSARHNEGEERGKSV